jgi:hypothetical protein
MSGKAMHGAVLASQNGGSGNARTMEESEGHFSLSVCASFVTEN